MRTKLLPLIFIVISASGLAILPAAAQTVTAGVPTDLYNSYPFGSLSGQPAYAPGGEYQQVYTASAFAGPLTIYNIGFVSVPIFGTQPVSATYDVTLSLSTTSASAQNPSADFVANKGQDFQTVFSGTASAVFHPDGTITPDLIFPTTSFQYDPAAGNLLLDVQVHQITTSGPLAFSDDGSGQIGEVYQVNGTGPAVSGQNGMVTVFNAPAAVPEPSAFANLLLGGSLVLGGKGLRTRWRFYRRGVRSNGARA